MTDTDLLALADLVRRDRVPGVSLWDCDQITDDGLRRFVTRVGTLAYLGLECCAGVTDAGIIAVSELGSLKILSLAAVQCTDVGLRAVANLDDLEDLVLPDHAAITPEGFRALTRLRHLNVLQVGAQSGPSILEVVRDMESVTTLGTRYENDVSFRPLHGVSRFRGLGIEWCGGIDDVMDCLVRCCPQLIDLWILGSDITFVGLKALADKHGMESLVLDYAPVTDDDLKLVGSLTNLRTLSLRFTQVTDRGIAALANLTQLRELDLYETQISHASLRTIARLPNLRVLCLNATRVSNAGVPLLLQCPHLAELEIPATRISRRGVAALRKGLPSCKITV